MSMAMATLFGVIERKYGTIPSLIWSATSQMLNSECLQDGITEWNALCITFLLQGKPVVTGEFPPQKDLHKRPVTLIFSD